MRLISFATAVAALAVSACAQQPAAPNYLANNTVLIVRHAEKPASGTGLTPAGEARARAYVRYFEPFRESGLNIPVDALFAGADSDNSVRPRLTLEPLSHASGLPLDTSIGTKDTDALVHRLQAQPHGAHPLIAWRHGQIPALLTSFGASTSDLPGGKWPDDTYDWVIVLAFDSAGHLTHQSLIKEKLVPSP